MLSATLNGAQMSFVYDSANRLISAGGNTYTYSVEDVRVRNLCGESETTYAYNTNGRLSQLLVKTTDGVVTKYVYGLGLIGEETSGSFKTYHFDYRGSTTAITDINGNVTDTFTYDTYGNLISRTGTSVVIFLYNGRDGVVTDDNGLIYMRARYYSPELRRFINADIIAGEISNAVTLNRYAYANGNPVSNIDPFGLSVERGNSNALNTIIDFFKNDTHSIYGEFLYNLFFGSGSISGGKSEIGYSLGSSKNYYPKKSATQWESFIGALAEITVANANGEIGIGNENISLSIDGDLDLLTAYAKAGANYKQGFGLEAGAGASVVDANVSIELEIFGFGVAVGVSGDILSAEAGVNAGVIKKKGETRVGIGADAGAGIFGLGFDIGLILPF